jgi:osmoprotectant transport system substrate-binding protein
MKKFLSIILVMAAALPLFAGGSSEGEGKGPITVGSKIDTEGSLLGNMILLLLEEDGFEVIDQVKTGSTPVVREAISNGTIDIYPEYTGNAFYFYSGQTEAEIWKDADSAWEKAKELDYANEKIVWLKPAPANNTWAIAVRQDLAEANNLETLEDLAAYINGGGDFKIAGSDEFFTSEAAMPAFEAGYGFSLSDDQILTLSGGNTALTESAASEGTDGVNAAMAYGTDGQLAAFQLVVMTDTKGIQPVYEPAPIIREEVLLAYPEIEGILAPVFASLDLVTLQTLNGRIAVEGEDAKSVAQDFLTSKGFLP